MKPTPFIWNFHVRRAGETHGCVDGESSSEVSWHAARFVSSLLVMCMLSLVLSGPAWAVPLPRFESDLEAHVWLRKNSHYYNLMAEDVDKRGGIGFGTLENRAGGMLENEHGRRRILLAKDLKGAERLSIHIFELTNAYQERLHTAVDERVRNGTIKMQIEFGLLHELIEYDGLRYHRFVLAELDAVIDGGVPREMLTWINPKLTNLASYELPLAFEFVEAQAKSGHTGHYHKWFWTQKSMKPVAR
jgi:hypothetical protein